MTIDYSTYKYIKVEVEDSVATVTLNRPEKLNAIPEGLKGNDDELNNRIFQDLQQDETVKAVIITGAGRGFCSGGDMTMIPAARGKVRAAHEMMGRGGGGVLEAMLALNKPIIAAVNGVATGEGASLALFCDIVIAAETASFADSHITMGVPPTVSGAVIWPLLVGPAKAKEVLMTGDFIDAKEAHRIGLVSKVVPLEDLMPTAKELARRLAHGPTVAIGWTRHLVNKKIKQDIDLLMEEAYLAGMVSKLAEDHMEAARAFAEKRKPQFKGR